MILEEEVRQMADRILAGDETINVTDIVNLINENRILAGYETINVTDVVKFINGRRNQDENRRQSKNN